MRDILTLLNGILALILPAGAELCACLGDSFLLRSSLSAGRLYRRMIRALSFMAFLAAVALVAGFGASFEPGPWYAALRKPTWTPPDRLFGPVWTVLYILIAVAGWLVWRAEGLGPALMAWIVQLALNGTWSFAMFGAHQIGLALTIIALLWVTIVIFMILARPVSRAASVLFVPYWAWVTYAALLNFQIWKLN